MWNGLKIIRHDKILTIKASDNDKILTLFILHFQGFNFYSELFGAPPAVLILSDVQLKTPVQLVFFFFLLLKHLIGVLLWNPTYPLFNAIFMTQERLTALTLVNDSKKITRKAFVCQWCDKQLMSLTVQFIQHIQS